MMTLYDTGYIASNGQDQIDKFIYSKVFGIFPRSSDTGDLDERTQQYSDEQIHWPLELRTCTEQVRRPTLNRWRVTL